MVGRADGVGSVENDATRAARIDACDQTQYRMVSPVDFAGRRPRHEQRFSAFETTGWDWPFWMKGSMPNPLDFFAAPRNFVQPILPGWFGSVTNITEQNSSAPDTEREIVAAQSYGRQLGRVMDALAVLIADLPKTKQDATAFEEFAKLRREIDGIKAEAGARRLDRIAADLATLKETKPEEYKRLAATLREALERAS